MPIHILSEMTEEQRGIYMTNYNDLMLTGKLGFQFLKPSLLPNKKPNQLKTSNNVKQYIAPQISQLTNVNIIDTWGQGFQELPSKENIENMSMAINITIKNVTDSVIENIDLFKFNHDKQRDVIYSSPTSKYITYDDILRFILSGHKKYLIGYTYITSNSNNQQYKPLLFSSKRIDGRIEKYTITPRLDPNQNQVLATTLRHPFYLNIETNITTEINANTTVTYSLYLKQVEEK